MNQKRLLNTLKETSLSNNIKKEMENLIYEEEITSLDELDDAILNYGYDDISSTIKVYARVICKLLGCSKWELDNHDTLCFYSGINSKKPNKIIYLDNLEELERFSIKLEFKNDKKKSDNISIPKEDYDGPLNLFYFDKDDPTLDDCGNPRW